MTAAPVWPGSPRACCRLWDRSVPRYPYTRIRTWGSAARSLPHQVAPFVLGAIEGLVGERHEAVGAVHAIVGERREPDADRHAAGIVTGIGEVAVLHGRADARGKDRRAVRRRFGHDDDELLAAVARHQIDRPGFAAQQVADLAQHGIAGDVAARIVDRLETVEIGQHHRERQAVAAGSGSPTRAHPRPTILVYG